MVGGHAWQGGVHGGGHAWQGTCAAAACMAGSMCGRGHALQGDAWWGECVAGGMHGRGMHGGGNVWQGGHTWQEKRQLQRAVRILLKCIFVEFTFSRCRFWSCIALCELPHNCLYMTAPKTGEFEKRITVNE